MRQPKHKHALDFLLNRPGFPLALLVLIAVLVTTHIIQGTSIGAPGFGVPTQSLLLIIAALAAFLLWRQLTAVNQAERRRERDLKRAEEQPADWHVQQHELISKFSKEIETQFDAWDFTPAEKEIAFLLLKGLSMKDIAGVRESTPHSIRQQACTLYHKADLSGRSDLSAHFLSELMLPRLGLPDKEERG